MSTEATATSVCPLRLSSVEPDACSAHQDSFVELSEQKETRTHFRVGCLWVFLDNPRCLESSSAHVGSDL